MKKRIKEKIANSQWRWNNIFKALTGLICLVIALIAIIITGNKTEASAVNINGKAVFYDVPLDIDTVEHIQGLCCDYEIPIELVLAVIEVESSYKADAVSVAGAKGLMQVIPEHHEDRMERLGCTDLYDSKQNVTVGVDFLAELIEKNSGNIHKALTAYNFGQNGANKLFFSKGVLTEYSSKVLKTAQKIKNKTIEISVTNFSLTNEGKSPEGENA